MAVDKEAYTKLFKREMTRREFLQFGVSFFLVVVGLSNIIAHITHVKKLADPSRVSEAETADHGFGSRKFGA
jgi:hypothetical protein